MTERIPLSQCTTVLEILYCETRSELKMLVRTSMCELIEAIDFFLYQNEIFALLQEIQNIAF